MTEPRRSDSPPFSPEFYSSLPHKHVASACVFLDDAGRVLLVKPTYKDPWELPGGGVEADESPWEACRREVREELALDVSPSRLLGVDYRRAHPGVRDDALRFVFAGGRLGPEQTAAIRLRASELSDWRFVDLDDVDRYVIPVMARRLRAFASGCDAVGYLEEGVPVGDR